MVFIGAKFCSHCGARVDRTELPEGRHELCPRCKVDLEAVLIGKTQLMECPKCEGIWADADSLQQICVDKEQQAAVAGMSTTQAAQPGNFEENIHYIPCPICQGLMNRVNFAHCSNVIVNVCGRHGTWFDKDELRRVVDFIRAGGFEKDRARQVAEIAEKERAVRNAALADAMTASLQTPAWIDDRRHSGISLLAGAVTWLLER
jgi:Zn-finger nucleic acid-binding protein